MKALFPLLLLLSVFFTSCSLGWEKETSVPDIAIISDTSSVSGAIQSDNIVNNSGSITTPIQDVIIEMTKEEILAREDLKFSDYFDELSWSGTEDINTFEIMYNAFESSDGIEDFLSFHEDFGGDLILVSSIKMKDQDMWNKYWTGMYEYYKVQNDETFLNDIKEFGETNEEREEWILKFTKALYTEIPTNDISKITKTGPDVYLHFNTFPIEENIKLCTTIAKEGENDYTSSCEDKVYFYRATPENNLCENINDVYKKRVCKDFLSFQL